MGTHVLAARPMYPVPWPPKRPKFTLQRLLDHSQTGPHTWDTPHTPPPILAFWAYSRTLPQKELNC